MWSVILSAGMGIRLEREERDRPKPLVHIGDETFLDRLYSMLSPHSKKIVIVGGHGYEHLKQWTKDKDNVMTVYNPEYHNTGNSLSALIGLMLVPEGEDVILTDGDILIKEHYVEKLANQQKSSFLVSDTVLDSEAMKAKIENNCIINLGKDIVGDAETIGMQKLSAKMVEYYIWHFDKNRHIDGYYEDVIKELLNKECVKPLWVKETEWAEIDTKEDLKKAKILGLI